MGLHDETSLTRRQQAQSHLLVDGADQEFGKLNERCLIEKRKKSALKQKKRAEDRKRQLEEGPASSSESSSSSQSSDTSSCAD